MQTKKGYHLLSCYRTSRGVAKEDYLVLLVGGGGGHDTH